jgi:mannosyltransferase
MTAFGRFASVPPMIVTGLQRNRLLLALIVVLGLGLRIYHLGLFPLWRDECFTRFYAEQPLAYLWTTGFHSETNPPGYYTLEHVAIHLFGTSAVALRLISVVASTLTIPLVYALGRTLANARTGLIGALVFSLCPSEIWYAQEARTYAVLQLMLGLMLLGFARYLGRPSVGPLVPYAMSAIGATYCHDTTLFVIAACNVAVLSATFGPGAFLAVPNLTRWLIANALVGVALVPVVLVTLQQVGASNISWVPPLSFRSLKNCFSELLDGQAAMLQSWHIHPWILLIVLGAAVYWLRVLDRRRLIILVVVPAVFLAITIVLSLRQSMIIPRAFLWLWIPLSVIIGLLLERRTALRWVVLALTLAVIGPGLKAYYFPRFSLKEDWRDLNMPGSSTSLLVLNETLSAGPLAYYHPEVLPRVRILHDKAAPCDFMTVFLEDKFHIPEINTESLRFAITSSQPVCLLTRSDHDLDPHWLAQFRSPDRRADSSMGPLALRTSIWNLGGDASSVALPQSK